MAKSDGPLRHEVCTDIFFSGPTCDKWTYAAAGDGYEQGWIGVAYQSPANNWGDQEGMDFSEKGYTDLSFMARGEVGGERLLVRSGGCTTASNKYPASYEEVLGVVVLKKSWERFTVPLSGRDLSNTCSLFSYTINRAMSPSGCTLYIDNIELVTTISP